MFDSMTGKVAVGVNTGTGKMVATMDETHAGFASPVKAVMAPSSAQFFRIATGSRYAVPIWDTMSGQLLSGYDREKLRPAGALAAPTSRKALVYLPASAVPVIADWNGFGVNGQSLGAGADAVPAITLTQPFFNLTFAGGPRSGGELGGSTASTGPLVETTVGSNGETICSGAANRAVELAYTENGRSPADFVVFAFDGARSSQTIAALSKGASSGYYTAFIAQVQRANTVGLGVEASFTGSVVTIASNTGGASGNGTAIARTGAGLTLSAATLSGGTPRTVSTRAIGIGQAYSAFYKEQQTLFEIGYANQRLTQVQMLALYVETKARLASRGVTVK